MAKQPSASVEMVAQEDQQIASRIKDFMSSLHEAKAEWGFFHMFMAQAVLRRPIQLALPVDGQNTITRYEHDKTREPIKKSRTRYNTITRYHDKQALRIGMCSPSMRSLASMSGTTTLRCPRHHVVSHCNCCRPE